MTHIKIHPLLWLHVLTCLTTLTFISCTSISNANPKTTEKESLPQYWLSTSLYAGRFWDDKRLALIDYRPFSAIDDAKTIDGYTIYPPNPDNIIKAGTLVKIIDITFPSPANKFKRPIYSPRNNIWVHFSVAKERGLVNLFMEKTHIMVMPKSVQNQEQLKKYLAAFLTPNDPNAQILQQTRFIQNAIWSKKPIIGMTSQSLLAALGPPLKTETQARGELESEQELWHYSHYFIVLENNAVAKIKNLAIAPKI